MQIQLGLRLSDTEYAKRLKRRINSEGGGILAELHGEKDTEPDLWLTDDPAFAKESGKPVIFLGGEEGSDGWDKERIDRYVPASELYRQLRTAAVNLIGRKSYRAQSHMQEGQIVRDGEGVSERNGQKQGLILSVYSPIGGCGKSCMAMALCEQLAARRNEKKTLYLNLEGASDWRMFFHSDGSRNLSDFLYELLLEDPAYESAKRGMEATAVRQSNGVFFIEPCNEFEDLNVLSRNEVDRLIDLLRGCFDYVVCDLSTAFHSVNRFFLQQSDKRYLLVNASASGQTKLKDYIEGLKRQRFEDIALGPSVSWIQIGEGSMRERWMGERCLILPVQRDLCTEVNGIWEFRKQTEWYRKVGQIAEEVGGLAG